MSKQFCRLTRVSETGKVLFWSAHEDGEGNLIIRYGEVGKKPKRTDVPRALCENGSAKQEADKRKKQKLREGKGYEEVAGQEEDSSVLGWELSSGERVIVADPAIREYIWTSDAKFALMMAEDGSMPARGFTTVCHQEALIGLFAIVQNWDGEAKITIRNANEKKVTLLSDMSFQSLVINQKKHLADTLEFSAAQLKSAKRLGIYQTGESLETAFSSVATNWF